MIQTIKKIIAAFLFIGCSSLALAQSDEVYLTSGDTLRGRVDILLPDEYFEEITLKSDGEKRRLKSFQMLGLKTEKVTYRIIKFGTKYRIMEEVMKGYLGLYRFRADNNYQFSSRFLYKATNEGMEVPNITFKKSVAEFVAECPAVQTGVNNKTYRNSNLKEMVDAFNACLTDTPQLIESEEEAIIEKQTRISSKELSLLQGIIDKLKSKVIDEELTTLLNDLKAKISKGEKVPGYLKSALKEATADYKTVSNEVSELLELL
ncbi:MAG: hypothetical protein AAF519_17370 [Bacteroidota bacterium]